MPVTFSPILSQLESDRFGVRVARANEVTMDDVSSVLSFCEGNDVDLLIARCDGQDVATVRSLIAAGLIQLEVQITFKGSLREKESAASIREGRDGDRATIEELARSGFRDMPSHFHLDPRLRLEDCLETYVDWSLRGLSGEAADVFYVTELDGRTVGFMMFAKQDDQIQPLLSTVSHQARGRGLYHSLIHSGMAWGVERGANSISVITPHGNIAAQRNLIDLGLSPTGCTATFHGWSDQLQVPEPNQISSLRQS